MCGKRAIKPLLSLPVSLIGKASLSLHEGDAALSSEREFVRVFNCYKSPGVARMIGDRRGRNHVELPIGGPSSGLPTGVHLLGLMPKASQRLVVSAADRRDFYTQLRVGHRKALKNCLYPPLKAADLVGTKALAKLSSPSWGHKSFLPSSGRQSPLVSPHDPEGPRYFVLFEAIFQGDHLGVEIATCCHRRYLSSCGLLQEACELRADAPFPLFTSCIEGLIIDDYFSISYEPAGLPVTSGSSASGRKLLQARAADQEAGLFGSTEKDVCKASVAKVGGAELDSSDFARSLGLTLAGAPRSKRLSLAAVSLVLCSSAFTTDSLHLCLMGGWTSILLYRRPLMSVFARAFSLVEGASVTAGSPKVIALPRAVADELVVVSALAPLACSDLRAPLLPSVFATDSSEEAAAAVQAPCGSRGLSLFCNALTLIGKPLVMTALPEDSLPPSIVFTPLLGLALFASTSLRLVLAWTRCQVPLLLLGGRLGPCCPSRPLLSSPWAHLTLWLGLPISSKRGFWIPLHPARCC